MAAEDAVLGRRNVFLALWAISFLLGIALLHPLSVFYLLAMSFGNSVVFFGITYGIYVMLRGRIALKIVGTLVIVLILGSVFLNQASINQYSVVQFLTWGQAVGESSPGNSTVSTVSVVTRGVFNSSIFNPEGKGIPLDAAWVQAFISAVNNARGANGLPPLTPDPTLDKFGQFRFKTMVANYQVSHFGLDKDVSCFFLNCVKPSQLNNEYYLFNQTALGRVLNRGAFYQQPLNGSYWQVSLGCGNCSLRTVYFSSQSAISDYMAGTYGNLSHVNFNQDGSFSLILPGGHGEEVLYPSGSDPTEYAAQIETQAPLHWRDLVDASFHTFGFFVGTGPTYAITNQCSATEVLGPNVNQTLFFRQQGCRFDIRNGSWLVVELGM